jgi:hypothetical protein
LGNVVKATPDLLFSKVTSLCGFCTKWDVFGLKSNPCVHGGSKKQPKRYTETFGDGKVVSKLGYELEHLSIKGVNVMREANVLKWLGSQQAQ